VKAKGRQYRVCGECKKQRRRERDKRKYEASLRKRIGTPNMAGLYGWDGLIVAILGAALIDAFRDVGIDGQAVQEHDRHGAIAWLETTGRDWMPIMGFDNHMIDRYLEAE
jgi:hypothetical protein